MPRKNPVSEKIKKDLANELNEFGYEYISGTSDPWILERKIDDFKIEVCIQKYRFDKNVLIMQITSNGLTANGEMRLREILNQHGNYNLGGAWKYDEESLEKVIFEMADIIIKECETIINDVSYRKPFLLDNEMYINLYNNHDEYRRLLLKENIELQEVDSNDVGSMVDIIQIICEKIKDRPITEQKEMILRIAAYLGELIVEKTGKQWVLKEVRERKLTHIIDIDPINCTCKNFVLPINILVIVSNGYMNNNYMGLKRNLELELS